MRSLGVIMVLGLALAGCETVPEEKEAGAGLNDTRFACDASRVQPLVGQLASQALGTEAVRTARARTMRWIAPGTAVTMDYRADRLNMHLDGQNRVTRIACG